MVFFDVFRVFFVQRTLDTVKQIKSIMFRCALDYILYHTGDVCHMALTLLCVFQNAFAFNADNAEADED